MQSQRKKEYDKEYKAENIKRVPLDMQITLYDRLKSAADAAGMYVNEYIKAAVVEKMEREAADNG